MLENPLNLLLGDMDFFPIMAIIFGLTSLMGLIFFAVLRYHFKRFNLRHDTKGFLILWLCSVVYILLLVVGLGSIGVNLLG